MLLRNDFERGKVDNFKVSAVDLGELKGIILYKAGHDELRVKSVEVDCPNEETAYFHVEDQLIMETGVKVRKCKKLWQSCKIKKWKKMKIS